MHFDPSVASFALGLISATAGWVVWWSSRLTATRQNTAQKAVEQATKDLNFQRDFAHSRRNQEQLMVGVNQLCRELDEINHELGEIKSFMIAKFGMRPARYKDSDK